MLQAPSLSTPVYLRSHSKNFWFRKSEKEEELIEALDILSSLSVVSEQRPHQQIMSAALNSCDNFKLGDQSPAYLSIPITSIVRRTPSVANAVKLGSTARTLVTGSTSRSEISNESLAPGMPSFDVIQTSFVDEDAARTSLKTVDVECCAMSRLDENDCHKGYSTTNYTLALGADKKSGSEIPPRLSGSGSPVLTTIGLSQSSKTLLQSPGFSSHGNIGSTVGDGEELGKQGLETALNTTVFYCKSVHLVPSIHYQLQETCKDSFLSTVDETVVQVRENPQLCSAFQSEENSLMRLPAVMSTSNQEHIDSARTSTPFLSAATGLHQKMDSVGTDGCTEKIHQLILPNLGSTGTWRISESNPRESSEQNQDSSTKLLCAESWNVCSSPWKESDDNERSETISGTSRSKTNLYSRHVSSWMNEFPYSLTSPKSKQQLPEGGSTRNLLRTCSHCGTMKTPLWRSGPSGPKSLCNACGIRLKKAGRRIATRENTDNSVSPPASLRSSTTSRSLKRKLDKPNSCPVDSRFAPARLKASQNHFSNLLISKKTNIFAAQLRKVEAGEGHSDKVAIINRKTYFSLPSSSTRRKSSACTHESPHTSAVMPAAAFEVRKHAVRMSTREAGKLETSNPTSLRRSFAKDEEEGAFLLMALSYSLVNA